MAEKIILGIIVALFTALLSTVISMFITNRREGKFYSAIRDHEDNCPANDKINNIEKAVIFLVIKSGGNLNELGLMK